MSENDERAVRLLKGAYALNSPADNRSYYQDFASHYDSSFAAALGYVGPEPIAGLISCCRSGAQAVIGVNAAHHQVYNFVPFMDRLVANGRIVAPDYDEVMIYDGSDKDYAGDTALIMRFVIT